MIEIKNFSNRIILFIVILLLITQLEVEAAFFSGEMEKFIRDGKEVTVMLEEGIKEIKITPESNVKLYSVYNNSFIDLEEGSVYSIKVDSGVDDFYKIQIFATHDRVKADKIWHDIIKLGYQEVKVIEEDEWYKVRLGHFNEKNNAEEVINTLKKQGWNPWLVKSNKRLPEKIFVNDVQGETIYTGNSMSIKGRLNLKGNTYNGTTNFQLEKGNIKLLHRTKLDILLVGIIQTVINELNFKTEQMNEFIKAYSIALRTNILFNTINEEGYIVNPNFKGIADKEFLDNFNNTEGIIIGNNDEFNDIYIPKIEIFNLKTYKDLIELNMDYKMVLTDLYNYDIIDLKGISNKKTAVDAQIERGLRYKEIRQINWQGPVVYTLIELDLNSERFFLEPVLANGQINGLQDLGKMVKEKAMLAGVNGGYFHYSGRPLGLIYKDENIIAEPIKNRTALLLTKDNQVIFDTVSWQGYLETVNNQININGVNRKPGNDQVTMFNNYYGEYAPLIKAGMLEIVVISGYVEDINYFKNSSDNKNSLIPEEGYIIQAHGKGIEEEFGQIEVGDSMYLENNFSPNFQEHNIKTAIAAGPQLIENGEIYITAEEEEFQSDIAYGRAPRSAVGVNNNNKLVFITVDGRQPEHSIGITLELLARFMLDYGITDGMNLDGGSSARMIVRGFTMNSPSGDRLISNGILIGRKEP